jgi:hypothetical protein
LIHAVEVAFESIYVSGPEPAELSQPDIHLLKCLRFQSVETALCVHRGFYDTRFARRCFDTVGCGIRSCRSISPTDCCDETRRLNIARRFGSAMISKTDPTLLIYFTEGWGPSNGFSRGVRNNRNPGNTGYVFWWDLLVPIALFPFRSLHFALLRGLEAPRSRWNLDSEVKT